MTYDLTSWAYDMQLRSLSQEERETFPVMVRTFRQEQFDRARAQRRLYWAVTVVPAISALIGTLPAVVVLLHR